MSKLIKNSRSTFDAKLLAAFKNEPAPTINVGRSPDGHFLQVTGLPEALQHRHYSTDQNLKLAAMADAVNLALIDINRRNSLPLEIQYVLSDAHQCFAICATATAIRL